MVARLHTREDSGIRLDRNLRWWHDDEPVEHPKVIEAFNRGLKVTADGRYRLEFGSDWCFVEVEEAAYGVFAVDVTDDESLSVRLTDRTAERLDPATLRLSADGVLTARVKAGRALARFTQDAHYAMGALMESAEAGISLRVGSRLLPLTLALDEAPSKG